MKQFFKIRGKRIGVGCPTFIVAEMSGNHKQDIKRAYKIIDEAARAGVDAIKLQTYTPDTMTIPAKTKWFKIGKSNTWTGQTLHDLYKTAYTPWEWQSKLFRYAQKKGLIAFSTPFDITAVDFLEKLNVPLYKIASFENVDLELLTRIGKTRKPVIISRGLTSIEDTKLAVDTLKKAGTPVIAILHCISSYPATVDQMNIATVPDIAERFGVIAGLSDHSLDTTASLTAVALGAKIIEKHFTLKRKEGGPDYAFSLEPEEMKQLVIQVRDTEKAIGKVKYTPGKRESENIIFRRSLFAVKDIKKGELFSRTNIRSIRPGYGLLPKYMPHVLGKRASRDIAYATPISWELILK